MKSKISIISIIITIALFICACQSTPEPNSNSENVIPTEEQQSAESREWTRDTITEWFGESDSFFEAYEVYFDEGISVKYSEAPQTDSSGIYDFARTDTVENIIFHGSNDGEILSVIDSSSTKSDIINVLGEPTFSDDGVLGYKNEDFYIFFVGDESIDEVSVYPRCSDYDPEAAEMAVELCGEGVYSRELAETVKELFENAWDDYNYSYDLKNNRFSPRRNSIGLAYYSKGIEVYYSEGDEDTPLLSIYGNFGGDFPEEIKDQNGHTLVKCYENSDLVFELEKERIKEKSAFDERVKAEGKISPDGETVLVDNTDRTGIDVISLDGSFPNYCIPTSPFQYGAGEWINNRYFLYLYGKGIVMLYDMQNEKCARLASDCASIAEIGASYIILEQNTTEQSIKKIDFNFDENGDIELYGAELRWLIKAPI